MEEEEGDSEEVEEEDEVRVVEVGVRVRVSMAGATVRLCGEVVLLTIVSEAGGTILLRGGARGGGGAEGAGLPAEAVAGEFVFGESLASDCEFSFSSFCPLIFSDTSPSFVSITIATRSGGVGAATT